MNNRKLKKQIEIVFYSTNTRNIFTFNMWKAELSATAELSVKPLGIFIDNNAYQHTI